MLLSILQKPALRTSPSPVSSIACTHTHPPEAAYLVSDQAPLDQISLVITE